MKSDSQKLIESIRVKAKSLKSPVRFMELCGTHSQTIAQNGIKELLPKNIRLVSGPGCPVCVTDQSDIDIVVGLALNKVPIAVYGDTMNVPGNLMSLEQAKQNGADVEPVYDVTQALEIKKKKTNLVFFGLGFETTTPMTAWAIKQGMTVYSAHKLFPPAMEALMQNKEIKVDGFINPGHVSAIIGTKVYEQFKIPQVIAGFEGIDVLETIDRLLDQVLKREANVENQYARVVRTEGNKKAIVLINEVFSVADARWRGLGLIPKSGLKIKAKYNNFDAEYIYRDLITKIKKQIKPKKSVCQCGLVLQGIIEPKQCKAFGKMCNPDNPYGACMVSVEGACNIAFRHN